MLSYSSGYAPAIRISTASCYSYGPRYRPSRRGLLALLLQIAGLS